MQIALHYRIQNKQESHVTYSKKEVVMGRPKRAIPDLDLSPDTRVSRPHARLRYYLGTWWVEDLDSKNGTFVNDEEISELTQLSPEDKITVGDTDIWVDFYPGQPETVSGTVENLILVRETQPPKNVSEDISLKLFANISKITSRSQGQPMLEAFLEEIILAFRQAEHWTIALIEDEDREIVPRAFKPKPSSHISFTLARKAIRRQEAFLWVRDLDLEPGDSKVSSLFDIIYAMYAPILSNNQVLGVVHVDTTSFINRFTEENLQLLSVIANGLGPAIQASHQEAFDRLHNVFISYSPPDRSWVNHLADDLRRRAVKVFFDERVQAGQMREKVLKNAIRNQDAFLLAWSSACEKTKQVMDELEMARAAKIPIIPLLVKPCPLPESIREFPALDMSDGAYKSNLEKLAVEIKLLPQIKPKKEEGAMKILFLAANPVGSEPLRLSEEVREIDSRLRGAEFRDRFELVSHWAVRYSDLVELLLRHKPHIVHFSGHGSSAGEIILEDETGESHPVSPQVLGKLFKVLKDNVQCVVLNACWSAKQADAIAKEIDCVVGMSRTISDDAAIDFASGFYQALGFGRNVQEAFDLGSIEIDLANIPESAIPNLITKSGVSASDVTFE